MARFPLREANVQALARSVVEGLAAHADVYPHPPALPAALEADIAAIDACYNAR